MKPFNLTKFRAAIAPLTNRMAGFNPTVSVPVKVDLSTIEGQWVWAWARNWTYGHTSHGRADLRRTKGSVYAEARFESDVDAIEFMLSIP